MSLFALFIVVAAGVASLIAPMGLEALRDP